MTIFEQNDHIGGILRYGIPEFRLPNSILDRIYPQMLDMGIKFKPNTTIFLNITLDDLFRDDF